MQLEQPATYLVVTQTSTYLIDSGAMRAHREPRQQPVAGAASRRLFTDGAPLVLRSLPEVEVGEPMRLMIGLPSEFLDRPEPAVGTPMVTTAVVAVSLVESQADLGR